MLLDGLELAVLAVLLWRVWRLESAVGVAHEEHVEQSARVREFREKAAILKAGRALLRERLDTRRQG